MLTEMVKRFLSSHYSFKVCVVAVILELIVTINTPTPTKFYFIGVIAVTIIVFALYNDRRLRKQVGDE